METEKSTHEINQNLIVCNFWCTNCDCGKFSGRGESSSILLPQSEVDEIQKDDLTILCDNSDKEIPLKLMGFKCTLFLDLQHDKTKLRTVLRKRSHQHYKREIEEKKVLMDREFAVKHKLKK